MSSIVASASTAHATGSGAAVVESELLAAGVGSGGSARASGAGAAADRAGGWRLRRSDVGAGGERCRRQRRRCRGNGRWRTCVGLSSAPSILVGRSRSQPRAARPNRLRHRGASPFARRFDGRVASAALPRSRATSTRRAARPTAELRVRCGVQRRCHDGGRHRRAHGVVTVHLRRFDTTGAPVASDDDQVLARRRLGGGRLRGRRRVVWSACPYSGANLRPVHLEATTSTSAVPW